MTSWPHLANDGRVPEDHERFIWSGYATSFQQVTGFQSDFSSPFTEDVQCTNFDRPFEPRGLKRRFESAKGSDQARSKHAKRGNKSSPSSSLPAPGSSSGRNGHCSTTTPPSQPQRMDEFNGTFGRVQDLRRLWSRFDSELQPGLYSEEDSQLSSDIQAHWDDKKQREADFNQKLTTWQKIAFALEKALPGCLTMTFGSTLNGFGSNTSDLDLCVFYDDQDETTSRRHSKTVALQLMRRIRIELRSWMSPNMELIPANIPILKCVTWNKRINIDISSNSKHGIVNTHLLFCYSMIDWRVRPLVSVIKAWAGTEDINDASAATLSSYTLTLMVINYLQCGVSPAVLPSLHGLCPDMFQSSSEAELNLETLCRLPFLNKLSHGFVSSNTESLGQLFKGFFRHYVKNFDFANDVPSVRTGRILTNSDCEDYARSHGLAVGQWRAYVAVEEPLDRTNAGRAVCRREKFDKILAALSNAFDKCQRSNFTLQSLLETGQS